MGGRRGGRGREVEARPAEVDPRVEGGVAADAEARDRDVGSWDAKLLVRRGRVLAMLFTLLLDKVRRRGAVGQGEAWDWLFGGGGGGAAFSWRCVQRGREFQIGQHTRGS